MSLYSRDVILFSGNVTLKAAQSITLLQGSISETDAAAQVRIVAPRVSLSGSTGTKADNTIYPALAPVDWSASSQSTHAALEVDADLIDLQNRVTFGVKGTADAVSYDFLGFQNVNFVSQGDIRFLASNNTPTKVLSRGDFSFTADQTLSGHRCIGRGHCGP